MSKEMQLLEEAANEIRTLALANPKLAFMLTRGMPLEKRVYTITLQWDTIAANQYIRGQRFQDKMFQMFWIWDICYTVRRPSYSPGTFGVREQDEYCKLNPYIDISIDITGAGNRSITEGMVPLENFCTTTSSGAFKNEHWVLMENQNVSIDAVNTRAFLEAETPYIVTITFTGLELSGCQMPGIPWDNVTDLLREQGLYPLPAARR
jgi:hypothetical protein